MESPNAWSDPDKTLQQVQFFQRWTPAWNACRRRSAGGFWCANGSSFHRRKFVKELSLTPTNLYVQLCRARLRLQECLNIKWFGKTGT